jgi:hypothetical protein
VIPSFRIMNERKADRSNPTGSCLLVGEALSPAGLDWPHVITIRNDTHALAGPPVAATPAEWRVFVDAVKNGEFDLDEHGRLPVRYLMAPEPIFAETVRDRYPVVATEPEGVTDDE